MSDLSGLGEGFYLDFPGIAIDPGCIYEQDFNRYTAGTTASRRKTPGLSILIRVVCGLLEAMTSVRVMPTSR